jgi:cytosine deaminase
VGAAADLVLLQASSPVEAIRLKATRLLVMKAGEVLATTPPKVASLNLPGRPGLVSYQRD